MITLCVLVEFCSGRLVGKKKRKLRKLFYFYFFLDINFHFWFKLWFPKAETKTAVPITVYIVCDSSKVKYSTTNNS